MKNQYPTQWKSASVLPIFLLHGIHEMIRREHVLTIKEIVDIGMANDGLGSIIGLGLNFDVF